MCNLFLYRLLHCLLHRPLGISLRRLLHGPLQRMSQRLSHRLPHRSLQWLLQHWHRLLKRLYRLVHRLRYRLLHPLIVISSWRRQASLGRFAKETSQKFIVLDLKNDIWSATVPSRCSTILSCFVLFVSVVRHKVRLPHVVRAKILPPVAGQLGTLPS